MPALPQKLSFADPYSNCPQKMTPIPTPSAPATGSCNGLHPESKFLTTKVILFALTVLSSGHQLAAQVVENQVFRLAVSRTDGGLAVTLDEKLIPLRLSEGNYIYRALVAGNDQPFSTLQDSVITADSSTLKILGKLAGLEVEQTFSLPPDKPWMEERIVLRNPSPNQVSIAQFEMGFALRLLDAEGKVRADLASDRVVAVPFRHRPDDGNGEINDFALANLLQIKGMEYRPSFQLPGDKRVSSRHHFSEGWAWTHGQRSLGLFSFNQEHLVFSVISPVQTPKGDVLRFGGFCYLPIQTQPTALTRIAPGQKIDLGSMRYQSIDGGYNQAAYAYRKMLDEQGCRFPASYNPPVHWNQLYEMGGGWNDRIKNYTKDRVEQEAAKAVQYSCEALYLDPGWDTTFGSFLWGDKWLGPRKTFIDEMQSKYGLKVSLHAPLPPWTTHVGQEMGPTCVPEWPAESLRKPPDSLPGGPAICMGSRAFLDEAEKRLLANCTDGVVFLMFDGSGWNGPCLDARHGHAIPYLQEDHIRTCIDLCRRIHAKYPHVLIELHDTLGGGFATKMTPVYYKYGPLSWDENWGFELMWNPMEDLRQGRGLGMYYYNLGCNVPIYLHVDLRTDNENCVVLWWFASTSRHLGIGGTHKDPKVVAAQKEAMKYYRRFEQFFKRGEFYGLDEGIHLHVLAEQKAFVVNLFNTSDQPKKVTGSTTLRELGLDPKATYKGSQPWGEVVNGVLKLEADMPPWSAKVADFRAQ